MNVKQLWERLADMPEDAEIRCIWWGGELSRSEMPVLLIESSQVVISSPSYVVLSLTERGEP